MNGVVVIGTELDTKTLEKQLNEETKKLEKYEKENEVLIKARVRIEQSGAMKEYEQLRKAIEQSYKFKIDSTYDKSFGDEETRLALRQKYVAKEKEEIAKLNQAYSVQFNKLRDINNQLEKNKLNKSLTKKNIEDINEKLTNTRGYDNIKDAINGIGKGTEKVIQKVGRWALAIFGIRSAYNLIRQSMNTLSQYNEKIAADIQNIRFALASALEPVIKWIIDLIYKLLGYLAYIVKAWTGKNIFENTNKGLNKAVSSAKELKKQLAGFDEMNILQDNNTSGSSGASPSVDLSKIQGDQPEWVKWIAKNGKLILSIIAGIVAGLTAAKIGLKGIKALGIGLAIGGLVYTIKSIIDYINDPSWENFGDILIGLGITIAGIAIAFGAWHVALVGVVVACLGVIASFWDDIKEFFNNIIKNVKNLGEDIKKWLTAHLGVVGKAIGVFVDMIVSVITEAVNILVKVFDGLFKGIKQVIDGIIKICKGQLGEGLKSIFKGIANVIIGALNAIINGLNIIFTPLRAIIMVAGNILGENWTLDDVRIPNIPQLARGGIVHNPGKGVLMGSYIAGEGASPEAVLPLDDDTMDRLGESIARHMTISANIINTMNGRVISRELQKINNESNFAYNG